MGALRLISAVLVVGVLTGCTVGGGNPPEQARTPSATFIPWEDVGERAAHTATALPDGRVLIAGGCVIDGCGEATSRTALVAADGASAVEGPRMAVARDGHTASALPHGDVLLAGGFPGEGVGVVAAVEVFDPGAGTISTLPSLAQARGGHAAATLTDGRVLVVGGWIAPQRYTASAEIIDPRDGTVMNVAPLPWEADALEAVTLEDGRVLVIGGQIMPGKATAAVAIFDPTTARWTQTEPMSTPRLKHFAVLLEDGRVLVLGGTSDDETLLKTTEIFDPGTGEITPGPDMGEPRYKFRSGAVVLSDGRVLVAGGGRTIEVLDIATGETQQLEAVSQSAYFRTATLLPDGAALVVGGYDERIRLVRSTRTIQVPTGDL